MKIEPPHFGDALDAGMSVLLGGLNRCEADEIVEKADIRRSALNKRPRIGKW